MSSPRLLVAFNPGPLEGEFLELFYLPRQRPDSEFLSYLSTSSSVIVLGDQGFGKTTMVNYLAEVALPRAGFEPVRVEALHLESALFQASVEVLRRLTSLHWDMDDILFSAAERAQELESNPSIGRMVESLLWVNDESPERFVVLVDNFKLMRRSSLSEALRALDMVMQNPRNLLIAIFTTVKEYMKLRKRMPAIESKLMPVFMPHFSLADTVEVFRRRTSWALGRDTLEPFDEGVIEEIHSSTSRIRDTIKLARLALERHLREEMGLREAVRACVRRGGQVNTGDR